MKSAAIVTKVSGRAIVMRDGQEIALEAGAEIFVTDSLRTDATSKLELRFHDNSELDLGPLSSVRVSDFAFDEAGVPPTFSIHVLQGLTRTASGKVVEQNPEGFLLSTPLGSAGIRGTVIWASVSEKQVVFTVTELGEGHTVIVTTADGRTVVIHIPETGVIITEGDTAPLNVFDMTPEQFQEYLRNIFQDDVSSTTPQGFYIHADSEFLATLGHVGVTTGFVGYGEAETLLGALEAIGVDRGVIDTAFGLTTASGSSDLTSPTPSPPSVNPDPGPGPIPNPPGPGPTPPGPGPTPPGPGPTPPGPFPTVSMTGSANPDTLIGSADTNHIVSAGAGNDYIVVYNGTDVVEAGYGSRDLVVKLGDMDEGSELYGDEKTMSGVTADFDYILVRGEGSESNANELADSSGYGVATMSGGAIYGDGHTLVDVDLTTGSGGSDDVGENSESSLPSGATGDTIRLVGFMTGGAIYGDAYSITADDRDTGNDVISIEQGLDEYGNLVGGEMSGGVIYGDAYNGATLGASNDFRFGDDSISVVTLSGDGTIYGDAYTASAGNGVYAGSDTISIGSMDGGAVYGDFHILENADGDTNIYGAGDTITVGGMSGGLIYGDAHTLAGTTFLLGGNNVIIIESGGMSGGEIYGSAHQITMNGYQSPNLGMSGNAITVGTAFGGVMTGGAIYGDAHDISIDSAPSFDYRFQNTISINNSMSDAVIYGNADTISVKLNFEDSPNNTNIATDRAFADFIQVGSADFDPGEELYYSLSGATIYGDAHDIDTLHLSVAMRIGPTLSAERFMADVININADVTNTTIYGDAYSIGSISFSAPNGSTIEGFMGDYIYINGTLGQGGVVYGDTYSGTVGSYTGTFEDYIRSTVDAIGHDEIFVKNLDGGKIFSGFGDDIVTVEHAIKGVINLGTGEDTLELESMGNGAVLHLDMGEDSAKDMINLNGLDTSQNLAATVYLYNFTNNDVIAAEGWDKEEGNNGSFTMTYDDGRCTIAFVAMEGSADANILL